MDFNLIWRDLARSSYVQGSSGPIPSRSSRPRLRNLKSSLTKPRPCERAGDGVGKHSMSSLDRCCKRSEAER